MPKKTKFEDATRVEKALVSLLIFLNRNDPTALNRLKGDKVFNEALLSVKHVLLTLEEEDRRRLSAKRPTPAGMVDEIIHSAIAELMDAHEEVFQLRREIEDLQAQIANIRSIVA